MENEILNDTNCNNKDKKLIEQEIKNNFNKLFKWIDDEEKLKKIKLKYFTKTYSSQAEKISCKICSFIPINSIQCSKCENLFCKECIKKEEKCKNCGKNFIQKTTDKTLIKVIEEMKLYCPYKYKDETNYHKIKFNEYKNHLLNCEFANYQCLICGIVIKENKKECIKHCLNCGFSDSKCSFCEKEIKLFQKKEHEKKCGEEKISCILCNKLIKKKDSKKHSIEECEKKLSKCKDCHQNIGFDHTLEKCKDNQIEYWKDLYNKEKKIVEMYERSVLNYEGTLYYQNNTMEDTKTIKPSLSELNIKNSKTYRNPSKKFSFDDLNYQNILEINSKILTQEDKIFLNDYFLNTEKKLNMRVKLEYSMSQNGESQNFHKFIDNKGPTISIFKIKNENIRFGGFTSKNWDSISNEKYDEKAFIFSLNNKKIFKTTNPKQSIYCNGSYGPFFGGNLNKDKAELWSLNFKGGFYQNNVYEDFKRECTQGLKQFEFEEIEIYLILNY